ncbi:MAG: hypothetical protein GY772_29390 [bacterium]|nr:hypothetical protein [bacterium]
MPILTKTASGQHHFTYEGPCEVAGGVPATLSFSLAEVLPSYRERDGNGLVRDQGLMEIQALDPEVTEAEFLDILPIQGVPEEWRVTITSTDANARIRVRLHLPHSLSR